MVKVMVEVQEAKGRQARIRQATKIMILVDIWYSQNTKAHVISKWCSPIYISFTDDYI